jgi:uncharacterized protein YdcH (DUF465 family)
MTSSELKSLVKEYFNLTEVKFGEIFDENKAFKIVFEGDQLELGMPVTVETTDGQKMDAPDGFHKLEGGMVIKTEGSKVVEITSSSEMKEKEEMVEETLEGGKKLAEEKMAEVEIPDVVEQFPVEVQRGAEYEGKKEEMETEEEAMTKKDIVEAVAKAVAEELTEMKKELMAMKDKMAKFAAEPAAEKTLPATKKFSLEVNATKPVQADRYEMMKNIIKTKKSK